MRRGQVWTVAGGGDATGKPRPAIIVQDDRFDATDTVTVCPLTTDHRGAPELRVRIQPTQENGLEALSFAMIDKVTTIWRSRVGSIVGTLAPAEMGALEAGLLVFLGIARSRVEDV